MASGLRSDILVIGSRGMLGAELLTAAGARAEGLDLPEFDATDKAVLRATLEERRPATVVNCAAYTNVDGCEDRREEAFRVNGEMPGQLALACKGIGAALIHVSTDFVFDGDTDAPYREGDPVHPLSVYGESKLDGERGVIQAQGDYLICRTAWLYGAGGRSFVTTMLRLAAERDEVRVVADQFGSPTWTRDLAQMILTLVEQGARGIVHTVNAGRASWCDLARETFRLAGVRTPVRAIAAAEFARKARTPLRSSVLSTDKFTRITGAAPRPWQEALADFIAEIRAPHAPAESG